MTLKGFDLYYQIHFEQKIRRGIPFSVSLVNDYMNMISRFSKTAFLMMVFALLAGCATKPPIPDDVGDTFLLERDLLGKTIATGGFKAIDGTERDFVVHIDGSWNGEALTLVEDFEYSDGVKERKTWVFTQLPNGEFSGIREDVIGTARGYQDGKAFRLEYTMAIPDENGEPGRKMKFRDVIVKRKDGSILNNATVGLWGFRVARVHLQMKRT